MPTPPMPAHGQMAPNYIASITYIFIIEPVMEIFADTQFAFATTMRNDDHGALGGATLGVEPTPQKRGPLPNPSWRRGRLPNSQARPRRPQIPLVVLLPYRNLLIALWMNLIPEPLIVVVACIAPVGTAARAMVRLGMASMAPQFKASGSEHLAAETETSRKDPEGSNAAERR